MLREREGTAGEVGYTKLFGGANFTQSPYNKDMSTHPEIPVFWYKDKKTGKDVYSTAAGAYQIMKETWWDLNGDIVKDHKKSGGKNEKRNFVEIYKIPDFSPKSQDELCIVMFKHYKAGLIEYLLNGFETYAIEEYASSIWASLTPGRYSHQGIEKDKLHDRRIEQLEYYNKYLKEELAGITDLHLEEGILEQFNIKCECNCDKTKDLIGRVKDGLDLNDVIEGLNKRAGAVPIGKCAKYIRLALEDGGMKTWGKSKIDQRPNSAKDYGAFLLHKGFKEVSKGNYKKGDIAVFEAFQGVKKYHADGHIQMYNGKKWLSDFIQIDFWAGGDYRDKQPNYKIYRWE